ncbi:uncharacterized protein PG998_011432 [Apiospora kogelbergensis]|uniref:uncharacterized protein n=1 Tax=Apiospora kogelbergensis TaxID=1337665 RepID=UPI00312EA2AC
MDHALQGLGLYLASEKLAELADDAARLARARRRFSESLPSTPSLPTTRSEESNPPTDEQQRYNERYGELVLEHTASWPRKQFDDESIEEAKRILQRKAEEESSPWSGGGCTDLPPQELWESGMEIVRKRWYEQGIWNDKWGPDVPTEYWKHEEPLDMQSGCDSENDTETRSRFLFAPSEEYKAPKSEEELQRLAEEEMRRVAECEASRPFHRFIQQVSEERQRIQDKTKPADPEARDPADINTTAYDDVKDRWVKRGIWDDNWGTLPGMNWKHEMDREGWLLQELGPRPATPPKPAGYDYSQNQVFGNLPDKAQEIAVVLDDTACEQPDVPTESRQDEPPSATAETPPRQSDEPQPARSVRSGRDRRGADTVRGGVVSTGRVSKSMPRKGKANGRRGKKASSEVPPATKPSQAMLEVAGPVAQNSPEPTRRSRRLRAKKL